MTCVGLDLGGLRRAVIHCVAEVTGLQGILLQPGGLLHRIVAIQALQATKISFTSGSSAVNESCQEILLLMTKSCFPPCCLS